MRETYGPLLYFLGFCPAPSAILRCDDLLYNGDDADQTERAKIRRRALVEGLRRWHSRLGFKRPVAQCVCVSENSSDQQGSQRLDAGGNQHSSQK